MDGGPSKINPPNSHPSNPIHKAAMAAQSLQPIHKAVTVAQSPQPIHKAATAAQSPQHEINKTAVIIGAVGVVALLFMSSR